MTSSSSDPALGVPIVSKDTLLNLPRRRATLSTDVGTGDGVIRSSVKMESLRNRNVGHSVKYIVATSSAGRR
jgi:hypothetical protein